MREQGCSWHEPASGATPPSEIPPRGCGVTDRLLTTREVAVLLGIRPETVLRWSASGRLRGYRISSNALRFRESEVEAWIEARVVSSAGEAHTAGHA